MTGDDDLVAALASDFRKAEVSEQDGVMLRYVDKLTREPWAIEESDVDALRAAGFGDAAILDICQVTAYFAYVNRIADGLGVELEKDE